MECFRSTVCYIDLDQMDANINVLKKKINNECEILIVLKADAYGHGAAVLMQHFLKRGIKYFAVASLNEALELRRANRDGEILIFGYTPDHLLPYTASNNIIQTVFSYQQARILSDLGADAKIHIKVDTGMNRLGFSPTEQSADEVKRISLLPSLKLDGIYSHLAQLDAEHDEMQYVKFEKFLDMCAGRGVIFPHRHLCNGKSAIKYPHMCYNMCRVGTIMTGFCLNVPDTDEIKPAMRIESEIVRLHVVPAGEGMGYDLLDPAPYDRLIATLPYGYADGIPKALSNHSGWVSVHGIRCEYTGNFCMDMCFADVSAVPNVKVGDKVCVYGGEGAMDFFDVRERSGIGLSNLQIQVGARVPRVYIKGGKTVLCIDHLIGKNCI